MIKRLAWLWFLLSLASTTALIFLIGGLFGPFSSLSKSTLPEHLFTQAVVKGYDGSIRYWGDAALANETMREVWVGAHVRRRAHAEHDAHDAEGEDEYHILALSSGGENGAFGAGLLNGWSQHGSRPRFDVVTGVSTGALSAPFAFLGPDYDQQLRKIYTGVGISDVAGVGRLKNWFATGAIVDPHPLEAMITVYANQDIMDAIAAEHQKGRQLLVGTTQIEAGRPVVWDMGAIASSDAPDKLELFQKILLASASIPGIYPPVQIKVSTPEGDFVELHVDGGTTAEVFTYPSSLEIHDDHGVARDEMVRLWIIQNASLKPIYAKTGGGFMGAAKQAILTLMREQSIGQINQIYLTAIRDGDRFHFAQQPDEWDIREDYPFQTEYMRTLFTKAFELGKAGYPWADVPPSGLEK